ncbi:hypothetical protein MTR67_027458 [Solanum verrucosum]|uniref:Uncharacterized protein n=1 Tax=Solanum verrucosum TaxID=315347 RepID=A0AAF0U055_SOLVR|nr:hypothetical protein MTR67_027458 [Solanum verrucosum]
MEAGQDDKPQTQTMSDQYGRWFKPLPVVGDSWMGTGKAVLSRPMYGFSLNSIEEQRSSSRLGFKVQDFHSNFVGKNRSRYGDFDSWNSFLHEALQLLILKLVTC